MVNATRMILLEVKWTSHLDFQNFRLSRRQRQRLENVYLRVQAASKLEVEFHYVVVSQSEGIQIIDNFLGSMG